MLQLMNVEGLTRENVASHLQKYRLQLKRTEPDEKEGEGAVGDSEDKLHGHGSDDMTDGHSDQNNSVGNQMHGGGRAGPEGASPPGAPLGPRLDTAGSAHAGGGGASPMSSAHAQEPQQQPREASGGGGFASPPAGGGGGGGSAFPPGGGGEGGFTSPLGGGGGGPAAAYPSYPGPPPPAGPMGVQTGFGGVARGPGEDGMTCDR